MLAKLSARSKWAIGSLVAVVLVAAAACVVYAANYSSRALPHTSVAGTSVAGMTRAEVVDLVRSRADAATVTITAEGQATTASLTDSGVSVDAEATAKEAVPDSTSLMTKLGALFSSTDIAPVTTTSDDSVAELAAKVNSTLTTEMKNAQVVVSSDGTGFTVVPDQKGNGVDTADVKAAVLSAAASLSSNSADVSSKEMDPVITTADAQRAADKATALIAQDVAIDDGIETYRATQEDKVKWVEFLTKSDGSLEDPSLDKVKVADWVNKTAQESDVAPVNGVNNVDSEGKVLTVAREGKPGLKTNNTEQIIKDLMASLSDGKDYSGTFHYDDVAPSWDTKQVAEGTENLVYKAAEGEKWVDIDLSTDTVTAYVGGKVAGGPFYMVPGAPDTPTVTGTFHVYLKYESQTMRGENADGSKYETEGVPWVTYFTGSYAMHGAPWRSSFGWSGYGGSHGCVNMPVDAAKFIYDWADMGSTVVVHY